MTENQKIITKETLIPISTVLGIATMLFSMGYVFAQIGQNKTDIADIRNQIQALPTQYQVRVLQDDVSEVKGDVKDLKTLLDSIRIKT